MTNTQPTTGGEGEALAKIIEDIENEIEVITKDWTIDRPFDGRLGTPRAKLKRSVSRMLKYYVPKLLADQRLQVLDEVGARGPKDYTEPDKDALLNAVKEGYNSSNREWRTILQQMRGE